MNEKVFLNYTQSELDRNYDQRGWIDNAEEIIARYISRSAETRRALDHRKGVPYGPGDDELLDIFPAAITEAPTLIFIHGGAWRNFTKDDNSFVANALVPAGIHVVVVNFSKLPKVRLPDVVTQVRRAVHWVSRHAPDFGGHPDKLYLCGHSSGAHLAAMVTLTNWATFGLPRDVIKATTCISGSYDLKPVLLSKRSSYLKLDGVEEEEFSPARHTSSMNCSTLVGIAFRVGDEC